MASLKYLSIPKVILIVLAFIEERRDLRKPLKITTFFPIALREKRRLR